MKRKKVNIMGMELDRWKHKGCTAYFAEGDDWVTLYTIISNDEGNGEATELLTKAKEYYKGKRFGGSVALNPAMKHLYKKLDIKEYDR